MSGIYLHIPFCKQACSYCDFYFVTRQNQQGEFVHALVDEIQSKKDSRFSRDPINTIYFGGGTPSLLSARQIETILKAIEEVFELDLKELTIELNPDDVTREYLSDIRSLGINRASMGVQTFDEELLKFMHRAHNREEALNSLRLLSENGFDTFTVDLIYGNPAQSVELLKRDLEILTSFNPPHVSAYSLTVEDGTRLGKQVELGRITPPKDDEVARHFDLVYSALERSGILQYEVSNFAKPGSEAMHNSAYWEHKNYLGFGPAAHSFWWDEDQQSAKRWNNKRDLNSYLEGAWKFENDVDRLNLSQLSEERIMLALRTKSGISNEELLSRYEFKFSEKQLAYLEEKKKQRMVEVNNNTISLTKEGLKIADLILLDLITA